MVIYDNDIQGWHVAAIQDEQSSTHLVVAAGKAEVCEGEDTALNCRICKFNQPLSRYEKVMFIIFELNSKIKSVIK